MCRVILVKAGDTRDFVFTDGAMNDLIRPTLYEAYPRAIRPLRPRGPVRTRVADIVGPVCESGDYLGKGRHLPPLEVGDLMAVMGAGAYGAVMASTYNSRPLALEVLVAGARHHVIRRACPMPTLLARDSVPTWLTA